MKTTEVIQQEIAYQGLWHKAWEHFKQDKLGLMGSVVVLLYFVIALGVWLGLWGTNWSAISSEFNQTASIDHWFGTNSIGQDISSRAIHATKVAFEVGLMITFFSCVLGVILGALSGFYHDTWIDALLLWLMGVLDSIPFYLFVAAIAFAMQNHAFSMHIAMVTVFWTQIARIIRSEVILLKQLEFVEAAQAIGVKQLNILFRYIIPNTGHLIIIQATLLFVAAIKTEVILSFLGLGVKNGVSWGLMIAESTNDIQAGYFNNFIVASGFLFILVVSFNYFSDALQDALDPKLKSNHDN